MRFRRACTSLVLLLAFPWTGAASAQDPVDRFLLSLGGDSPLPADATALIRRTWKDCRDCDANEFLTQGLALSSPRFREGLDAYDAELYAQCAEVMGALRSVKSPFIALNAAAYEIKSLVAMDRLLEAGRRIEQLLSRGDGAGDPAATHTYFAAEMAFLRGYCLLADLRYDPAEKALTRFLEDHPDASQRLVLAARQMLAELQNRQPGGIGEVVDLMDFAGRRLTHGDAGEPVQGRQVRVIEILDGMIEEAEAQESSSSSGGGAGSGSSGRQSPSNPMQDSFLPGGGPGMGSLRAARRANPAEVWGSMPPAERERILQALRDHFPSRYRKLVEQYYEQLAKKP
jgi:hypothetical protein